MFYKKPLKLLFVLTIISNVVLAEDNTNNYINFDVEGANYTEAISINEKGIITGSYNLPKRDDSFGFIRMPNGEITRFSVDNLKYTHPVSINTLGTITGYATTDYPSCDYMKKCKSQGFIRTLDGKITTFEVPEAKGGTYVVAGNDSGVITGYAKKIHTSSVYDVQGFVRDANGKITSFDVPGAKYTKPLSINNDGVITGCYALDADGTSCFIGDGSSTRGHGFVRKANGTFITFDVSGALLTYPTKINNQGEITGFYNNGFSYSDVGFVRNSEGIISTFNTNNEQRTRGRIINNKGVILGEYFNSRPYGSGGFTRETNGLIREWKHPDAAEDDTIFTDINEEGIAVGYYYDYLYAKSHAFLINTTI